MQICQALKMVEVSTHKLNWFSRHWAIAKEALAMERDADASALKKSQHEREFLPAVLEVVDTPAHPAARVTAMTLAAFVIIAVAWSIIGSMDIVAVAPGKVIPTTAVQVVQPKETAEVKYIHVREGQFVQEGDLLIELDPTSTQADAGRLTQDWVAARIEAARLRALVDDTPAENLPEVEGATPSDIQLNRTYLISERQAHLSTLAALDNELDQRRAEERSTLAQIQRLEQIMPIAQERADSKRDLLERGVTPRVEFLDRQEELIDYQQQLVIAESRLDEVRAAIKALGSERDRTDATFRRDILARLTAAEQRAASLSQEVIKAQDRDRLMTLRAPVSGTVQQLQIHTVGGVVTPAQELMTIVPADTDIEVEAMLLNKDVGFVRSGQDVKIKVESFPFTKYGTLDATVTQVSQDSVADENLGLVYPVRLQLHQKQIPTSDGSVPLGPGMAVTAEIRTGTRQIIQYLVAPLNEYLDESMRER